MNNKNNAGHTIYNKFVLSIYDWWVLGFSNPVLWKCPTKILEEQFKNVSENHLDVGVGTGYYLKKCLSNKNKKRRLALLDLNPNSLKLTASRVSCDDLEIYQEDVLNLNLKCELFDSISVSYLLHCLPGPFEKKAIIFEELKACLNPGGTLFGSTIIGKGLNNLGFFAKRLMSIYNKKGIFCNYDDGLKDLSLFLNHCFSVVDLELVGCVAIFKCS